MFPPTEETGSPSSQASITFMSLKSCGTGENISWPLPFIGGMQSLKLRSYNFSWRTWERNLVTAEGYENMDVLYTTAIKAKASSLNLLIRNIPMWHVNLFNRHHFEEKCAWVAQLEKLRQLGHYQPRLSLK